MPRISHGFTEQLFARVRPENKEFAQKMGKDKSFFSLSHYIDTLLEVERTHAARNAKKLISKKKKLSVKKEQPVSSHA
jgi:hypothetical protein